MRNNPANIEKLIFGRVNRARVREGVGSLEVDWGLVWLSRQHSLKQAKTRSIWHGNNVHLAAQNIARYRGLGGQLRRICSPCRGYSGENVAMLPACGGDFEIAQHLHHMWMKSPGHRENILNSKFSLVGIGVKNKGRTFYATELFYG